MSASTNTSYPSIGDDGRQLLAAASLGWSLPVLQCPGWDGAELVRHMGVILGWMDAVVTAGERVPRRDLPPPPPTVDDLPTWYSTQLERTIRRLDETDPQRPTWTFSSRDDRRAGWWRRRLAVEIAIHRWDAENAVAAVRGVAAQPIDGVVAAAGVEEYLVEFLPGMLTGEAATGLTGTLHLHATDGTCEWWIDLDAPGQASAEHRKGDTAVRGTRSDLLLWLTNRVDADVLDVVGSTDIARRWTQLHH